MGEFRDRERNQEWVSELVTEGEYYGLTTETARELMHQACDQATDRFGRLDEAHARARFYELAAVVARRGGRLRRVPGKGPAVGEDDDEDTLGERPPGKVTLVELEQRRRVQQAPVRAQPAENGLPHEREVASLRAAARVRSGGHSESARDSGSTHAGPLALESSPVAVPYRTEMETFFGEPFGDAKAHVGEHLALAPHGARAAAFESTVVFASESPTPEVVAHELAHVAQHRRAKASSQAHDTTDGAAEAEAEAAAAARSGGASSVRIGERLTSPISFDRGSSSALSTHTSPLLTGASNHLPGPVILEVVGDRFEVELSIVDAVPTVRVQYIGPARTRLSSLGQNGPGTTARHVHIPLAPVHLRNSGTTPNWNRPLQARAIGRTADTVAFDLYGDGSAVLEVQDRTDASTLEVRAHAMWARINRVWAASSIPRFDVELSEPVGDAGAAAKRDPTGQRAVVMPLVLNGDRFELGARRFGDTNQMLLSLRGDRDHREILVPIAGGLRNPGLRILSNDGRNLSIDLDGDGRDDATLIHTIIATGAKPDSAHNRGARNFDPDNAIDPYTQHRNHYLDVYDARAIRVGQLIGQAAGYPIAIPADQDHIQAPPPQGEPQPADRAPVQGDVPAEQALAVKHASRDWELRFDGNGDRAKELLLRVVPQGPPVDGQARAYTLSLSNLDSRQTSGGLTVTLTPAQWQWFDAHGPRETVASDGISPTTISFVPESQGAPLSIELQRWPADPPWYQAYVRPGSQSYPFFVDATPPHGVLASGGAEVEKVAGVLSTELELGEYRDRFRFTVEETPRANFAVIFGVTALGPGQNVGGVGYRLAGRRATALRLHSISATSLAFDTTGSGTPDLFVYDAISAPMDEVVEAPDQLKMPARDRDHRIRIVDHLPDRGPYASQIPPDPYTFRIRDGQLVTGYKKGSAQGYVAGAGQSVGLLTEQGALLPAEAARDKTSILQAQIGADSALLAAATGVLNRPEHAEHGGAVAIGAWSQLHEDMIYVQAQRQRGVAAARVASARAAAEQIVDWLRAITATSENALRPQYASRNAYTGEKAAKTAGHASRIVEPAYGAELVDALAGGDYDAALASYRLVAVGFYQWIRDQLEKEHGAKSSVVAQFDHQREMDSKLAEIAVHADAFRVPAAFVADQSYARKDGYGTYRTIPMQVFVWREGSTWHIRDLTSSATRPWQGSAAATDYAGDRPPRALFEELNHPRAYPKGVIRYHLPDGRDGNTINDGGAGDSIECDEHKTWEQHLSELALALGAIGLIAATGGLGLVATVAFAGSAVAGIGAVGARLDDAHEHGYLTGGLVAVSVVEIAQNLASLGVLSAGKVLGGAGAAARGGAAWSGAAARIAQVARAAYKPLVATEVATTGTMLLVMTTDVIEQLEQLDKTVPEGERTAARARLLGQFAVMGGLSVLSIRGELPSVWQRAPIIIDTVNGLPVARAAGVEVGGERVELDATNAGTHAIGRWTSADFDEAARMDPASPRGAAAREALDTKEARESLAKWLAQEHKLDAGGRVIPPEGAAPELVGALQRYADASNLAIAERALATADELAAIRVAGDGLDLDPLAPSWRVTREKLIKALGNDVPARRRVAAYERARSGASAEDLSPFFAQRATITQLIPESELETIRRAYPEGDVYLGGELARPTPTLDTHVPVEVTVVAPEGTTPELMHAMEQRLDGHRVHPDAALLNAHGLSMETALRVRVRVVTADQFFGLAVTPRAGSFHKLDSTMPAMVGGGRVRALGANEFAADAGDLAGLHAAWKARGGPEQVSRIHYNAHTNTSMFEIVVGPAGARHYLRVRAHIAPRITTVDGLRNGEHQVVGNPIRSLDAAHTMLRELMELKLETFAKLGVDVPPGAKLELDEALEFGLGRTSMNEYVVVLGGRNTVDWGRLPGLEPVAHTHPSHEHNNLRTDVTGASRVALTELLEKPTEQMINRQLVFPTAADISVAARTGVVDHRVFTPFVLRDGFVRKPEAGEKGGRLEFVIRRPREIGHLPGDPRNGDRIVYEATLIGELDGAVVLRTGIWGAQDATGGERIYMRRPDAVVLREAPRSVSARSIGDGLAPGCTLYTIRAGLEEAVADQLARFKVRPEIEVWYADEFIKKFQSEQARAIFRPREHGTGVIYARPDARPQDILEELIHARQMDDPKWRAEILRLDAVLERNNWHELSIRDRLGHFRRKLEIEINAQQRLKRDAIGRTDDEALEITETLSELRRLEREVSLFSDREISDMSAGLVAEPQYLRSPPWLASKVRRLGGQRPNRADAFKEDAQLAVVPKEGPSRSAAYNTRENVQTVRQFGAEWTEVTHVLADHSGVVSIRSTDKGSTVVITTRQGDEHLYPVEKGTPPRVAEGQQVESGNELAVEERRYRQVRIDLADNTREVREEILRLDGDGWVQRGSETSRRATIMETAARMQLDARLKAQGVDGARRIEHRRGGGGFDDVVVFFSGSAARPTAKILIREVKGHIDDYVPLQEFSAIRPPGLGDNLRALQQKTADALEKLRRGESLSADLEGISSAQLAAIRSAVEDNHIEIEIVLGPTTKLGSESSKRASVVRDIRREIIEDRGKDLLAKSKSGEGPERIDSELINKAAAAEKDPQ